MQTENRGEAALWKRMQTSLLYACHWQQWEGAWPLWLKKKNILGEVKNLLSSWTLGCSGEVWLRPWYESVHTELEPFFVRQVKVYKDCTVYDHSFTWCLVMNQEDKAEIPTTSSHPQEFLRLTRPASWRSTVHCCFWWKHFLDYQTSPILISKTAQGHCTWFLEDLKFSSMNVKASLQHALSGCYLRI